MTRIYLSSPDVGPLERQYLLRAFDEGWIAPLGPDVDAFEEELSALCGPDVHAVALSSGTAGLHLALLESGVGPGDRVFVSSFTFAASANPIVYCGAEPVFIDADPQSWNMSPSLLEEALGDAARRGALPRAVIVVDLYGQVADFERLGPLCDEYGVPLIEDAAEAVGSTRHGRAAGTFGSVGVFSFNGNKILTTSGGGALLARSQEAAARYRYLATQARQPVVHYEHVEVGFNYRLSNLLAAVGRAQLQRLPKMIERRRSIHAAYREALGEAVSFMPLTDEGWNAWLTCVVFESRAKRDAVQRALAAEEIESRPLWKPMHLQPVYEGAECWANGTSERLFEHGLCLPSGSALSDTEVERVIRTISRSV